MKKVFAICGSTKNRSSNLLILEYLQKNAAGLEFEIFSGIDTLPHFNPDLDKDPVPSAITAFRSKICESDLVIFCTPEYVFSLPGSLKNALDWMVSTTIFSGKTVAQIVASASGEKASSDLNMILTTLQAEVRDNLRLLIKGVKGKVSESGEITDLNTKFQLEELMARIITLLS